MSRLNWAIDADFLQIDSVILKGLAVWFLSFDLKILSANQITWFFT